MSEEETENSKNTQQESFRVNSINTKISLGMLVVVIFMGIFFRFYQIENVFTEMDDIGVVASHRATTTDYMLKKNIGSVEVGINVKKKFLLNLLESPLFFAYVGSTWTYPPGQYIFYPLLIDESDSLDSKIVLGRSFSALFSCASLILFVYLLFLVNDKKIDVSFLIPSAVFAFSFNSVLYAHHMGPQSVTVTTLLTAIILFIKLEKDSKCIASFFMWLGVLTWFNYLILIAVPIFTLLAMIRFKFFSVKEFISAFYKGILTYLIIFIPLWVLFFKPSSGSGRGGALVFTGNDIVGYFYKLWDKFVDAGASMVASFSLLPEISQSLFVFSLIAGVFFLIRRYKKLGDFKYAYVFSLLYLCSWVVLYIFHKLPMEPNRHVLILLPGIALCLYLALNSLKLKPVLHWFFLVPVVIGGSFYNYGNITERLNRFDYSALERNDIKTVLLYGGSVAPLLYFKDSSSIYSMDKRSFWVGFKKKPLPNKMLLTSQVASIETYKTWNSIYWKDEIFDQYEIVPIREDDTGVYFSFNNASVNSMPNSFFLYELIKKEKM